MDTNDSNIKQLLLSEERWLTREELREVYAFVYPTTVKSAWDSLLNAGNAMPVEAVKAELGADIVKAYEQLVSKYKLPFVGERKHSNDPKLFRHLWNSAWRASLMGLPLEARLAALMHELPEHRARGVDEANKIISEISKDAAFDKQGQKGNVEKLGPKIANLLDILTDYEAIAVDHVGHCLNRNGTRGNIEIMDALLESVEQSIRMLKEKKSKAAPFYERVKGSLKDLQKTANSVDKRVIHPAFMGIAYDLRMPGKEFYGYLRNELKAALNPGYVKRLFSETRKMLEEGKQDYYIVPAIRAISHIDKVRTTNNSEFEKATREAMTFLGGLGMLMPVLDKSRIYNNVLYFLNEALKTELLRELGTQVSAQVRRPDTALAAASQIILGRYTQADELYGGTAIVRSPKPPMLRFSSPSARS